MWERAAARDHSRVNVLLSDAEDEVVVGDDVQLRYGRCFFFLLGGDCIDWNVVDGSFFFWRKNFIPVFAIDLYCYAALCGSRSVEREM